MNANQAADTLSIIGYFLTLAGLLGSFFYIHLSGWYREVTALDIKWTLNRFGDDRDRQAVRRECRYEIEKIASWTTLVTTLVITTFILLVAVFSIILWTATPDRSQGWLFIGLAGLVFLISYVSMTAFFIGAGYRRAVQLKKEILDRFSAGTQNSR